MKICIVTARFPSQRCGIGDYSYYLASTLARSGHEIDILTGVGPVDEGLYPLQDGLRVHRVVPAWSVSQLPRILVQLRRLAPESVCVQYTPHAFDRRGLTLAINIVPALARFNKRMQVVTNYHELFLSYDGSPKRRAAALWQRVVAMAMAAESHGIAVTDAAWKERLRALGVRKPVAVIPVGSNIPVASVTEEERTKIRARLLQGGEGVLLAGFGAWADRSIPGVLYGLSRLLRSRAARLVWIGGADTLARHRVPVERALRKYGIRDGSVMWLADLPHPTVSRIVGVCDMMVLPYVDGISTRRTTAITALQHGVPVLSTQGFDPDRHFVHGETVYLVPVADDEALADAIVSLAERPALRARLSARGRRLYETVFAWDVIAQRVSDHLLNHSGSMSRAQPGKV